MFLFQNDYGIEIRLDIIDQDCNPKDISNSTAREFEFVKPDGTTSTKTALYITDGTDGKLYYVVEMSFLDLLGVWTYRGKITIPGGVYRTEKVEFTVRS
jgi:hypothetical protein